MLGHANVVVTQHCQKAQGEALISSKLRTPAVAG
jgi:hypothetical protein